LNIYSSSPCVLQPADLEEIAKDEELAKQIRDCNIYVISKRPRLSAVPASIQIEDGVLKGDLQISLPEGPRVIPFSVPERLPPEITTAKASEYPHTRIRLYDSNGNLHRGYPISFLLPIIKSELGSHADLEIIYVGQAYGNAGSRNALDRLQAHSTLQKILADMSAHEPHVEAWLFLYRFEFHKFILSMDGLSNTQISDHRDRQHYLDILSAKFERSMRISVAEAALIRWFQPKYNEIYKSKFPHNKHKILKKVYDLDFAGLSVEINSEEINARLCTAVASPKYHHICNFNLHSVNERKSFFFGSAL